MTFSNINTSTPNSGLGDKLRDAFNIVNDNFAQIEDQVDLTELNAILEDYATKVYVDAADIIIQEGIDDLQTILTQTNDDVAVLEQNYLQLSLDIIGKDTLTQLNNSVANLNNTIADLQIVVDGKVGEAPLNNNSYGRRNGNWVPNSKLYEVYSAILTQTGTEPNIVFSSINTNDIVIGRSYRIVSNDANTANFINIGAPSNDVDVYFVATGTNPASWGNSFNGVLQYDVSAPVVNVLENTIGSLVWFFKDNGLYSCQLLTDGINQEYIGSISKSPTLSYLSGNKILDTDISTLVVSMTNAENEIELRQFNDKLQLIDGFSEFIEIRVYN